MQFQNDGEKRNFIYIYFDEIINYLVSLRKFKFMTRFGNRKSKYLSTSIQLQNMIQVRIRICKIFTIKWSLIRCLKGSTNGISAKVRYSRALCNNNESSNFYFAFFFPPPPPIFKRKTQFVVKLGNKQTQVD